MDAFAIRLQAALADADATSHVWYLLPNHYHCLVTISDLRLLTKQIGRLHGGTSFDWNAEDGQDGARHCWHRASDRAMRGERHFWATVNYVHHNPVRHGYVKKWQDWPWSSSHAYVTEMGREKAEEIWKGYPVDRYGDGWDDPAM
jgi:putative transposase